MIDSYEKIDQVLERVWGYPRRLREILWDCH